jgi:hypothetical protein
MATKRRDRVALSSVTSALAKLVSTSSTSVVRRSMVPGMRSGLKSPVSSVRRSEPSTASSSGRKLGMPAPASAAGTS